MLNYRYRAAILTELHKLRSFRIPGSSPFSSETAEYPVLHLRRRASDWSPFVCLFSLRFYRQWYYRFILVQVFKLYAFLKQRPHSRLSRLNSWPRIVLDFEIFILLSGCFRSWESRRLGLKRGRRMETFIGVWTIVTWTPQPSFCCQMLTVGEARKVEGLYYARCLVASVKLSLQVLGLRTLRFWPPW